ncbi:LAFE_0G02674g1_1 [Lachancea fermentati]|uniref:LAFE_0G02674g1_1 n=1 Tax=Lachancea fermentati TaxID=4955 RepID=A0A1G4MH86_LACFM|nr:LAFE_0G02674g1_1 [Lachancea fermentati]
MGEQKSPNDSRKLLKLISISFKEASLDSPSFRASVNFYHLQVESIEAWIENASKFLENRFLPALEDFKQISDTLFAQALPPRDYLYNGVVENQLYTPELLDKFHKSLRTLSDDILNIIKGDPESYLSVLMEMMNVAIEPYKEIRKGFDYYQSKHDALLAKYQSIKISSSNVEPSSIREDAFQLFEVRKSYLQASLDLTWEISKMQENLDGLMIKVVGSLIRKGFKKVFTNKDSGPDDILKAYTMHQRWCEEMSKNNAVISKDIQRAKEQIQAYSIEQLAPSRELNDYNVRSINQATFRAEHKAESPQLPEKSGWLYMKTFVGKPSRQIWVRRWCFLKKSVFGMLLLSPSKTSVEETDKFGVLLTSVRYDPDEERKFCFEVKIVGHDPDRPSSRDSSSENITLVFQAETLSDLKCWLKVFDDAKRRVLSLESKEQEYEMAFSRFPPIFFEFACSSTTSIDKLVTTSGSNGTYGKSLLQLIEAAFSESGNIILPDDSPFDLPMLKAPVTTKLTKLSIISSYFIENDGIPSAIMANFWGSVDWSGFCFSAENNKKANKNKNSLGRKSKNSSPNPDLEDSTLVNWNPIDYPDYYPKKLRNDDIQFRTLFFSATSQNRTESNRDILLMRFSCTWSPNTKQGFSGLCFVTLRHMYFYMNSMGFICLLRRSLNEIVSIESSELEKEKTDGLLKLYDMQGLSMRTMIFFEDANLIASKMRALLDNSTEKHSKSEEEMLSIFTKIEKEYELRKKVTAKTDKIQEPTDPEKFSNIFWKMNDTVNTLRQRQQSFQPKYSAVFKANFNIPCRALVHVMFGDRSNTFPKAFLLADRSGLDNSMTAWHTTKKDEIAEVARKIRYKLSSTKIHTSINGHTDAKEYKKKYLDVVQIFRKSKENFYYEVDQRTGFFDIPFAALFKLESKYIIMAQHEKEEKSRKQVEYIWGNSSLYMYYNVVFVDSNTKERLEKLSYFDRVVKRFVLHLCYYESMLTRSVLQQYLGEIGRHGKIIKAIRICGQLGVVEDDKADNPVEIATNANIVKFSRSLLFRFLMRWSLLYLVNTIFMVIRILFHMLHTITGSVLMLNRTILLALILSIIVNLSLTGKTALSYWSVRRAESMFKGYVDGGHKPLERAVYIKDLDLLSDSLANNNDVCFQKFLQSSDRVETKYRKTRHEIAVRRNEVLVELKILASMEKELVHGDYMSFLLEEIDHCTAASHDFPDVWDNDTKLQEYCDKVHSEYENAERLL